MTEDRGATRQLEHAVAQQHVDAFLEALPAKQVHALDLHNVRAVFMVLMRAQGSGVPRLQFNVKRINNKYTLTASGYDKYTDCMRLVRALLGSDRRDELSTVEDFALHPESRACVVYMYSVTLDRPPEAAPIIGVSESDRAKANRYATAYLDRLGAGVVRSLDRDSVVAVLSELALAQSGVPALRYSVHLDANTYTVSASGYTGAVRAARFAERVLTTHRSDELRQVTRFGMHAEDRALVVLVSSIAPTGSSASKKRRRGRPTGGGGTTESRGAARTRGAGMR